MDTDNGTAELARPGQAFAHQLVRRPLHELVQVDSCTFVLQEGRTRQLKRALESWREVVLALQDLLAWERGWHPGAILAATSLMFVTMWLLEPSLLTAFSLLGLAVCLLDYWGPALSGVFLRGTAPWAAQHERRLDELCRSLVLQYTHFSTALRSLWLLRATRPRVFYACTGSLLLAFAWLGSVVHNLLLLYLIVTGLLLMPGLRRRGLLAPYAQHLSKTFMQMIAQHHKRD